MLIWVILFIIVFSISFILALRSMHSYRERPKHFRSDSSLFLIQNPLNLTPELLTHIIEEMKKSNSIISIEKLFKGNRQALVIFGPSQSITNYKNQLSLIELDDYTDKFTSNDENIQTWEMLNKDLKKSLNQDLKLPVNQNIILNSDEQFWWQVVVHPNNSEYIIRAVLIMQSEKRSLSQYSHLISQLSKLSLISLPRSHTKKQLVEFYKDRSLGPMDKAGIDTAISANEILNILNIFS